MCDDGLAGTKVKRKDLLKTYAPKRTLDVVLTVCALSCMSPAWLMMFSAVRGGVINAAPSQCSLWVGVPYTESASQLKMRFSCAPCKLDSVCRACARVCHK